MLSDEEKEALRSFKSEYETCDHYSSDLIIELDDAEIILNLIEKQSKEIEELKTTKKELTERVLRLESDKFWDNVVSKDKIKAKIEELDKDENASIPDFMEYAKEYAKGKLQSLLEKE